MSTAELKSLWEGGECLRVLVEKSGLSMSTVRRRLRSAGCDTGSRGSLQGVDWEEIRNKYLLGASTASLAEAYGLGKVTVYRHVIDLLPKRRARYAKNGFVDKAGYALIEDSGTKRKEHIVVMERNLGRKLLGSEKVHHIDTRKTNNALSNLHLYDSQKEHNEGHLSLRSAARAWCVQEGLWPSKPGARIWGTMELLGGILFGLGKIRFVNGRYTHDT